MKKYIFISIAVLIALFIIWQFFLRNDLDKLELNKDEFVVDNGITYLNTASQVKFVGMENCYPCHKSTHAAFSKSEMHRSFEALNSNNIIETFSGKNPVYDEENDYYYEMIKENGKYYQVEFKMDKQGYIIHERKLEAQYTMGSGNNLRMYFYVENGMFYQLPLTWNSHKKSFDLSPGFRDTGNLRFKRYATTRCMGCHNSYQKKYEQAIDRFKRPFEVGINCERCHGPGELHIKEMKEDLKFPENYKSIVNPRKLSSDRQLSVCMQCHLQGKAWAPNGKSDWFDFRAGQLLETNRSVYFPAKTEKEIIEVGDSPHRLLLSKCFTESKGALTCISCHDPHYSIKTFSPQHYNNSCISCHQNIEQKTLSFSHAKTDDCVSCHMNRTGTDNTLHGVSLTDHWIRVDANNTQIDWSLLKAPVDERPLVSLSPDIDANDNEWKIRKGIAYIDFYKENDNRKVYLDSAITYLKDGLKKVQNNYKGFYFLAEAYYLKNDHTEAIINAKKSIEINQDFSEAHFLLGKSYELNNELEKALKSYKKASSILSKEPRYLESIGSILYDLERYTEAADFYNHALEIDSLNAYANFILGNIFALNFNQPEKAIAFYMKTLEMDPDIHNSYLNLGNAYSLIGNSNMSLKAYLMEIKFRPKNVSAYVNLGRLYSLLNRNQEAKMALNKALDIDPNSQLAKKYLSEIN